MFWAEEHDIILVRKMLANSPFANMKRGIVQRGRKCNEIAEHLSNVQTPRFKVDQRGVRERCAGEVQPDCQDLPKEN